MNSNLSSIFNNNMSNFRPDVRFTRRVQFSVLASLLLSSLAFGASAAPIATSVTADGVQISAGDLGAFTLGAPTLKNTADADVPLVSRTTKDAQTASYKFFDDTIIEVSADNANHAITVDYSKHSPTVKSIVFRSAVPFSLREGGKATFDGNSVPFPLDLKTGPEGHSIWRGEASRFEITTKLGQILAIAAPRNWQQLQDDRFWNDNKTFEWIYFYDMARDASKTSFTFQLEDVAGGAPAPILPSQIVDRFGQSKLVNFPDKMTSDDQLKSDVAHDKAYYANFKAPARDTYGGLPDSGQKLGLKKTGFFHIQTIRDAKRGTLPVLVDPEGNLFFQLGLCSLGGAGDSYTFVAGRGDKFDWLPPAQGEFASAFIDGGESFSFYATNWIRKFGQPWDAEAFSTQTINRVRQLGFNSSGAFSGWPKADQTLRFPHVGFLPFDGMEQIPDTAGIIDPFADGAAQKLDANFARTLPSDNADPLVIGHFLGNEQGFENIPKIVPGLDAKSGAKRKLVSMLRAKYTTIAKWNSAWQPKTSAKSFDELADARLFVVTKAAADDVNAFYGTLLDAYYKMIAQSYRKHCPNHLLLGNRWLSSTANDDLVVRTAGKYLDVVSANYYTYELETSFLKRIHELSGGRPILLSEWHYGATDQGLSGGARQVKDQRERGLAYRNYVEQAASLGFVIGQEWFSYLDQPLTGRWFQHENGEKGNIGLVNVADRPYKEFLAEATRANFGVYDVMLGKKAPFRYDDPRFSGAVGGNRVVLVPRALPNMTINGVQDNWPGIPAERITRLVLGTNPESGKPEAGKPASADFRLAWDDANLYLFIQVKDPTPMQNPNVGDAIWQGDSIELFCGADKLSEGGALQFGDRQVLLSAQKGADGYHWFFNNSPKQFDVKMVTVRNVAGDGYTLEAAIPWAGLGFKPRENQEILFDIGFNDTTSGRRQFMWNGGARNSGDRGAWGRARLVK